MDTKTYWENRQKWTKEYGPILQNRNVYDPRTIKQTCSKCHKVKHRIDRHHKCSDYYFACVLPSVYAKRYLEFRAADCDYLCRLHHSQWHRYLAPKLENMYAERLALSIVYGADIEAWTIWCEKWRSRILDWYVNWLGYPPRHKKKSKKRKRKNVKISKR
jgi:hypothetical protein